MKLLREITDLEVLQTTPPVKERCYNIRRASRTVLFNDCNKIAILHVAKDHYHKLPGGGVETGEDVMTALEREVLEEVGVQVKVLGEVGMTIEYRNAHNLLQISFCFLAEAAGDDQGTSFTAEEINDGFMLKWMGLQEAIKILESDQPASYVGKFIRERDLIFLKAAETSQIVRERDDKIILD